MRVPILAEKLNIKKSNSILTLCYLLNTYMATKTSSIKTFHTKKEVKKELANKIETALPEIKESLGKKKFNKRLKKATRLITEGLHLNGVDKKNKANEKKPRNNKSVVLAKEVEKDIPAE